MVCVFVCCHPIFSGSVYTFAAYIHFTIGIKQEEEQHRTFFFSQSFLISTFRLRYNTCLHGGSVIIVHHAEDLLTTTDTDELYENHNTVLPPPWPWTTTGPRKEGSRREQALSQVCAWGRSRRRAIEGVTPQDWELPGKGGEGVRGRQRRR